MDRTRPGPAQAPKTKAPRASTRWAAIARKVPGAMEATLAAKPFEPQLALLGPEVPEGPDWIHELKFDGYRLICTVVAGRAHLWSRNGLSWTAKLPDIALAIEGLGLTSAAFDGELIAGGGKRADFGLLPGAVADRTHAPVSFVLFDLLHLEGISLERAPLLERKALLAKLLAQCPAGLSLSTHVGDGAAALAFAIEGGFEGIVSKRLSRPYVHGRNQDWRKTKNQGAEQLAVVGYTRQAEARSGFSSLLLARPTAKGWVYAGRVGTGFSDAQVRAISAFLAGGQSMPTVAGETARESLNGAVWFEPRFVVEVINRGTARSGVLRHCSLKAVRPDKDVDELLAHAQ